MDYPFIENLDLSDKRVLVRVDFNVPLDSSCRVTDPTRIEAAIPTLRTILDRGGTPILMSHLGRPKAEFNPNLSLAPVAQALGALIEKEVILAPDCIGEEVEELVFNLKKGSILLLENLRFHRAETHPEEAPEFGKTLASFGDCFVNDAFAVCHREHSSVTEIPKYLKGRSAYGYLIKKEIEALDQLIHKPKHPFCALIGGAKISTKIGLLHTLAKKADTLMIGGAMSYTFLKAKGFSIGRSLCEEDRCEEALAIMQQANKIILPVDVVVAAESAEEAPSRIVAADAIPDDFEGVDLGPKSCDLFAKEIALCQTLLWNGPVGLFELEPFAKGTRCIAQAIAQSSCTSVVGGGDSVAAIKDAGIENEVSHISTGGGATLTYIEKGRLPGIEALSEKAWS